MADSLTNEGEILALTDLLAAGEDWELGLVTADSTPDETDVAATWTAREASWPGYARKTLTRTISSTTWSTPVSMAPVGGWSSEDLVAGSSYNESSPQTFTYSGASGVSVYGYFYIGVESGKLWLTGKFPQPQPLVDTNQLVIIPQYGAA